MDLLAKSPEKVIEHAVWGMIPHTRLGRRQIRKLYVYAGPDHPHSAQKPQQYMQLEAIK
jgi:large subunit ribosomal protein L13